MRTKIEEPKAMRELHAIREKHFEDTKHMTWEKQAKLINNEAKRIVERYNLKFKYARKH